ncbi:hypothetical protein RUND412_003882 [Rhizina undulata]
MRLLSVLGIGFCHLLCLVSANVEKEIFLAPPPAAPDPLLHVFHGSSESPCKRLPQLVPSKNYANGRCRSFRALLDTSFQSGGKEHWVLLDALEEGTRYEVRICWPATSPTDFYLSLHTAQSVASNLSLSDSLREYRSPAATHCIEQDQGGAIAGVRSFLYLHVRAKTSYYSYKKKRMDNPEPVEVEIILDPYLFNVAPESLIPVGGVILVTALLALPGSAFIYKLLRNIASAEEAKKYRKTA